jgi:carboxypeptidase C (cathepsin A)
MIWSKILSIILCLLLRPAFARRRLPNEVSDTPTTKLGNLSSRDLNDDESHRRVRVPSSASPDDHLVTDLPLLDNSRFPVTHWAGLLPASDDGHNYLFYWLFAPEKDGQPVDLFDPSIPLVIWLNGGKI